MRSFLLTIALAISLLVTPAHADAAEDQFDLKVAIVFNILRFTRFDVPHGSEVTLCVIGSAPLVRAFEKVDGERLPVGRIVVRRGGRGAEVSGACTIVYFAGDAGYPPSGAQALTIGEAPGFASHGAVALHQFGRQISFEINTGVAARQGAAFSARLLNLAAGVRAR
ncbi:YfiR family protein [Sphingomonas sp. NPDC079357]|uniref:YfiR family protein n=1 Tax=Sphingomonas sp. NPDC079357 TaxID=3364518 RepID=UPI00384D3470